MQTVFCILCCTPLKQACPPFSSPIGEVLLFPYRCVQRCQRVCHSIPYWCVRSGQRIDYSACRHGIAPPVWYIRAQKNQWYCKCFYISFGAIVICHFLLYGSSGERISSTWFHKAISCRCMEDIRRNAAIAKENEGAFVKMVSDISKTKLKKQMAAGKEKEKLK